MTLKAVLKSAEKFVTDNSPGILTGLGVAGAVTTAVLTGKASYSAALILASEHNEKTDVPAKEQVKLVWREYIPAAVSGVATVTCIVMANQIGSRRAAAIAAAFKLSEKMSEEYREKVTSVLGERAEEKARSELSGERMKKVGGSEVIVVTGSETLFFDEMSGRFFKNDIETIRQAVNEINHQINNYYSASLTEFWEKIGLARTDFSDGVGWNSDELLQVQFNATLVDEGRRPAIGITYNKTPITGFARCN